MIPFRTLLLQAPLDRRILFAADKTYVVVAVLLLILGGVALLLLRQERRLRRLERTLGQPLPPEERSRT